jgi:hypothetical protein
VEDFTTRDLSSGLVIARLYRQEGFSSKGKISINRYPQGQEKVDCKTAPKKGISYVWVKISI